MRLTSSSPAADADLRTSPYVVILGGGMAGLTLARQLLLRTDRTILLVDPHSIPPERQKVGESNVQVQGYYLSKVLDLEEHLFRRHYLKYNLRFYWPRAGTGGQRFEDFDSGFIRKPSNIPTFQLDRNEFEAELIRLNCQDARFQMATPVRDIRVDLGGDEQPHRVRFTRGGQETHVECRWLVDASGRRRFLAKKLGFARKNSIRHGATFFWLDGLTDIEKLTDADRRAWRLRPDRRQTGHFPFFLATNHFMGRGFWFWVIPLHDRTSFGLVYDNRWIDPKQVSNPQKAIDWICRRFPLFEEALRGKTIVAKGTYLDFSHDCKQTLSCRRWAMTGEAGRFTDPFYSPGGDLIALHNTFITDLVATDDPAEVRRKIGWYEAAMRALYEAYIPSYAIGYHAHGDAEAFVLKYAWELAIYFGFYVFPFINDLFPDPDFLVPFLNRFSKLGVLNRNLQRFFAAFCEWKEHNGESRCAPVHFDFMDLAPLARAEKTFYDVGVSQNEAIAVLDMQLRNMREFALFIAARIAARAIGVPEAVHRRSFVSGIDLKHLEWDEDAFRLLWERSRGDEKAWEWSFDVSVMDIFIPRARDAAAEDSMRSTAKEAEKTPA